MSKSHGKHSSTPSPLNQPGGHGVHTALLVSSLNVPAGQGSAAAEPSGQKLPAGQMSPAVPSVGAATGALPMQK